MSKNILIISILLTSLYLYDQTTTYPTDSQLTIQAETVIIEQNKPLPSQSFSQDSCTLFPNRLPWHDFRPACLQHDIAYWAGGTDQERIQADIAFRDAISHTGPIGPVFSFIMYHGVRLFGDTLLTRSIGAHWGYGWD